MRVLYVEDDSDIAMLAKIGLEAGGDEVVWFGHGAHALDCAGRGERFDVVLLDVMLPDLDGFEILRRLRQIEGFDTPVVFLSARAPECAADAQAAGAAGVLGKPFNPLELGAAVRALLR